MAIFALGTTESNRELKNQLKQYLVANINKRRDYLKQHTLSSSEFPVSSFLFIFQKFIFSLR